MNFIDFLMILVLIMIISFVCFIVGMFNPSLVIKWGSIEGRNRKKVFLYYGLGALFLYVFTRISAINYYSDNVDNNKNTTNTQTNISTTNNEIIKVTPKEIDDAFKNNQINAEQKYKGKSVSITGKVYDIDSDNGKPVLGLVNTDNKYDITVANVRCYFSNTNQNSKIAKLSKGQTITIKGTVDGYGLSVITDNCTLE
jgi:hypothetical protein